MQLSSTIVQDVVIKGTLEFQNSLFLDSHFEGEISGEGDLTLGSHAVVKGDIHVHKINIEGTLKGNVHAEDSCTIASTGVLVGDVKAETIKIVEGATFHGFSKIPFKSIQETELPLFDEEPTSDAPKDDTTSSKSRAKVATKSAD